VVVHVRLLSGAKIDDPGTEIIGSKQRYKPLISGFSLAHGFVYIG
jgi:hypothetical protein